MFLCDENSREGSVVTNCTTWTILCVEGHGQIVIAWYGLKDAGLINVS